MDFFPDNAPYNAKGNGVDDDIGPLTACIRDAAKVGGRVVLGAGKIFAISSLIVVPNGIKAIVGPGQLKALATSFGFYLKGKVTGSNEGITENVGNLEISGITFDGNDKSAQALIGENVFKFKLNDNVFKNFILDGRPPAAVTAAVVELVVRQGGGDASKDIEIRRNVMDFSGAPVGAGSIGIKLKSDSDPVAPGDPAEPRAYWRKYFKALPATLRFSGAVVANNVIKGPYYGVSLELADGVIVEDNTIALNTRNISVQNGCRNFTIRRNVLVDCLSTAVHIAFGGDTGLVQLNTATSSRSLGAGMFQAEIGPKNITFDRNSAEHTGVGLSSFFYYVGVMAENCTITGNRGSGQIAKAFIGVDSGWLSKTMTDERTGITYTVPAYNYGSLQPSDDVDNLTGGDSRNIVVRGNILKRVGGGTRPAIFMNQLTDRNGHWALRDCIVEGNRVLNDQHDAFISLVASEPALFSGLRYTNNYWLADTPAAKIDLGNVVPAVRRENGETPEPFAFGPVVNVEKGEFLHHLGPVQSGVTIGFVSKNTVPAASNPQAAVRFRAGKSIALGFNTQPTTGLGEMSKYLALVDTDGQLLFFIDGGLYGPLGAQIADGSVLSATYTASTGRFSVASNGQQVASVNLGGGALSGNVYLEVSSASDRAEILYFGASPWNGTPAPVPLGTAIAAADAKLATKTGSNPSGVRSSNSVAVTDDPEAIFRWRAGWESGVGFTDNATGDGTFSSTKYALLATVRAELLMLIGGSFYTKIGDLVDGDTVRIRYARATGQFSIAVNDVEVRMVPLGGGALANVPIFLDGPVQIGALAIEYFGPKRA